MSPEEIMAKGEAARRLLDEPLIQTAFKELEAECFENWKNAPARDAEGREWLWMMHQATQRLKLKLEGWRESGRIEAENMKVAEQHRRFVENNYLTEEPNDR